MGRALNNPLARGFYTVPEAARLIRVGSTRRIYGWLRGYPRRDIGPLLYRDYKPVEGQEELSFLDLMEVRFVEHFREHGVKVRSLRIAADTLRNELNTDHPFATDKVHVVADRADVMVREVLRDSADKAGDIRLRSLVTNNYVMYEAIKHVLLPGIEFDASSGLANRWAPVPDRFPKIVIDPRVGYGQPVGEAGVPTGVLYDAWKAEKENPDAVAYWFDLPTTEVIEAVRFEDFLSHRSEEQVA